MNRVLFINKKFKTIIFLMILSFLLVACKKRINDADINKIVSDKNISEITWNDFDGYMYQEDKTSKLVRIYTLDNGSTLILSGALDSENPTTISIVEVNGDVTYLKDESVKDKK
ncbi:hypothetical protein [Helcococcus kunzii]